MSDSSPSPIPWTAEERGSREAAASQRGKIRSSARDLIRFAGWLAVLMALCRRGSTAGAGLVLQGWLIYGALLSILQLGLPQALFGMIPRQDRDAARQTVWLALALSLAAALAAGGALLLIPSSAGSIAGNPALIPLVQGIALWLVASLPGEVGEAALGVARPSIWLTALQAGYWAALAVAATGLGTADPSLLFTLFAVAGLARSLFVLAAIQSRFGLWTLRMDSRLAKRLAGVAAFLSCAAAVEVVYSFADKFVASRQFGAEGFALYMVGAIGWPVSALILIPALAAAQPRMERALARGDEALALLIARSAAIRAGRRALFLAFYLLAFARLWLGVLFGDAFRESAPVLITLLPLPIVSALSPVRLLWGAGLKARSLQGLLMAALLVLILGPLLASGPLKLAGPAAAVGLASLARTAWELRGAARRFRVRARRLIPWQDLLIPAAWSGGGAALAALLVPLLPYGETARLILGSLAFVAWSALMKWGPLAERAADK